MSRHGAGSRCVLLYDPPVRGVWLILFAAILWGTTGTAQELGPDAASPLAVGSLRLLLGAAVLVVIAILRRPGAGWRWLVRPATLFAAIGVAGFQLFFFSAVARTGVAVGTLLALGSAAVFVGLIEAALARGLPERRWMIATTPAILGLAILAISTRGDTAVDGTGVVLALAAGLSYATYIVSAARLAQLGSIRHSTAAVFCLAAVALVPVALSQDLSFLATDDGALMVLWLGFATLALAYLLFSSGLRDTDPSTAATLSLAEPVTATILGVAVLGERPGPAAWLGIALIILGLVLASRASRPEDVVVHG
jgi:drug/metabolite transporter, DME family